MDRLTWLKAIAIGMTWILLLSGCAAIDRGKMPAERFMPEQKWNLESYAKFVKENMAEINARYTSEYDLYEFVVDTEYGSTVIQNLIDLEAAATITADLETRDSGENRDPIITIYQYITEKYDYVLDPHTWRSVAETINTGKGDCKSLSLLLMACLTAAGYDAYAAISNGHMWVTVNQGMESKLLELDRDPERNTIYSIPGFYESPLYKIYPDRSEKRRRIQ
jgi:Transglutaminase-like superfamily